MELRNKKIAFLGDSITEGPGASCIESTYWNILGRNTGAQCFGYGISGTRIAKQITPSSEPRFDRYFGSRVEEMIPDADVVVVFGGTNDFGHGDAPFGTQQDRTEDTYCGALHVLMEKLINRYPDAMIVFMTPLHRLSEDDGILNELGVRACGDLQKYVDAILEAAAYYGIPVLDLFRTSGMQPKLPLIQERFMPDGLHPNDAGHVRLAARLEGFLRSL